MPSEQYGKSYNISLGGFSLLFKYFEYMDNEYPIKDTVFIHLEHKACNFTMSVDVDAQGFIDDINRILRKHDNYSDHYFYLSDHNYKDSYIALKTTINPFEYLFEVQTMGAARSEALKNDLDVSYRLYSSNVAEAIDQHVVGVFLEDVANWFNSIVETRNVE